MVKSKSVLSEFKNYIDGMKSLSIQKCGDKYSRDPVQTVEIYIAYGQHVLSIMDESTYNNPFTPSQYAKLDSIQIQDRLGELSKLQHRWSSGEKKYDIILQMNDIMSNLANAIDKALVVEK